MKAEIRFFANGNPMSATIEGEPDDFKGAAAALFAWLAEQAAHAPARQGEEHLLVAEAQAKAPKR